MLSNRDAVVKAEQFSDYLNRLFFAHPEQKTLLETALDSTFSLDEMKAFAPWSELITHDALSTALRQLRQAVMARIISRDLFHMADLNEVMMTISQLADFSIRQALYCAKATLAHYGLPIGYESGEEQDFIIVAMGKLGGYELNVSSDIDLIFLYPEQGDTQGGSRHISNQEYFLLLGKEIIKLLNEVTTDGFVFRVDMRLRPYGDSGPLVMSLNALEQYLVSQGREWERYAWAKARVVTGDDSFLKELVRPFVYRKYLDYSAYGAMRDLHSQIRREVAKKDKVDNIKLGPGGIREIEFIAQVFQLIRGGRDTELQSTSTRYTLKTVEKLGLLEPDAITALLKAYTFLRELEHRLQYIDDQQTQTLPQNESVQIKIAHSMGFEVWPAFVNRLNFHRRQVMRYFEQVFILPTENAPAHPLSAIWQDLNDPQALSLLEPLGFESPEAVVQKLRLIAESQRYNCLPAHNKKLFDALLPELIEVTSHAYPPDITLFRILDLLEAISRRAPYLALLTEYPQTLQRLATFYSSSIWVANYLTKHPMLLDELLDARVLYATPDWQELEKQLHEQLSRSIGDVESQMDILRHFQHAQTFRLAAQDLMGMWSVEALSDELSLLADLVLAKTLHFAWLDIKNRHQTLPKFAIIGYGKLGGKELGYASDLDIIFLYEDDHPDSHDIYARLARRMITWLTSVTSAGSLYDIDLRLRPNGESGLMVSTTQSFEHYQKNHAWVWEHQAITRARFIAGDDDIKNTFNRIRLEVLTQKRDISLLKKEVVQMRKKIEESFPSKENDLKHARGGIIDTEFIVQYIILAFSNIYPTLTLNTGTIALLNAAADLKLINPKQANQAGNAYRLFRQLQHVNRLNNKNDVNVNEDLLKAYNVVKNLWHQTLET